MTLFIFVAALLVAIAGALLLPPLLRSREGPPRAIPTAIVAGTFLIAGSAALYLSLSRWPWTAAPAADGPQAMIAQLARRLERDPDHLEGWLLLGRSYAVIGQTQLSARAYLKADGLAGGQNAEALLGIAEARVAENDDELRGRAGELIERALALDPTSGRALFYGAAAAQRREDWALARRRFAALLALAPPEGLRPIIEQQIRALDAKLGTAPNSEAPAPNVPPPGPATPVQAASTAVVRISISIAPNLAATIPADAPLFVIARDPAQPGPPLAVKRVQSRFPQSVELGASDAMLVGRALAPGQKVQLVARIARSGTPQAHSGDPFGETFFSVGASESAKILIDRLTP